MPQAGDASSVRHTYQITSSSGRSHWLGVLPDVLILRLPLGRAWEFRVEHSTSQVFVVVPHTQSYTVFLQVN